MRDMSRRSSSRPAAPAALMLRARAAFGAARALLTALLFILATALSPASAQEAFFEVPSLNAGLPAPSPWLDRATPRSSMEAFQHHGRRGEWDVAAQMLDLSGLAEEDQAARGPEIAQQLYTVLDRKVVIPWNDLIDRPDGMDEMASTNSAVAGMARRSVLLDLLDMNGIDAPLRLNRLKAEGADPVWLFSQQTVQNVGLLYDMYGPTRFERWLPDPLLTEAFWGLHVWEVVFLPILLVVGFLASKWTHDLVRWRARVARKRWRRLALNALCWPASLVVGVTIVGFGTRNVLVVSGSIDALLEPGIFIGYAVALVMFVVSVLDRILDRLVPSGPEALSDPANAATRNMATTVTAVRRIFLVVAVLLATGLVLAQANLFRTLGLSLLASAGALTLVLGFAARQVLGNIMASLQIAMNRSARIGDQLIFRGEFVTVEYIHFTFVQLRIWTGNRLVVPVSDFVSEPFQNWSIEERDMIRVIDLVLHHEADVSAMRNFFISTVQEDDDEHIGPKESAAVRVVSQDAFGTVVRFELPSLNPSTGWDFECVYRERLLAHAHEIGTQARPAFPDHPPLDDGPS